MSLKEALYHHEKGRLYRPTQVEIASGVFNCPYCRAALIRVTLRKGQDGYTCPTCHWSIHRDDIFQPVMGQEPELREPGDATADSTGEDIGGMTPPPPEADIADFEEALEVPILGLG